MDDTYDSNPDLLLDKTDGGNKKKTVNKRKSKPPKRNVNQNTSHVDNSAVPQPTSSASPSCKLINSLREKETAMQLNLTETKQQSPLKLTSATPLVPDIERSMQSLINQVLYRTDNPRRGICLIISNDVFDEKVNMSGRIGAATDLGNVLCTFQTMGFDCRSFINYKMHMIKERFLDLAKEDHSDADCFACVVLTHGETEDRLYMYDGLIKIDDIVSPFKGSNCPTLIGKPKLFFIQACRGSQFDDGITLAEDFTDSGSTSDVKTHRIPIEADVLLSFSVSPGYYSWRNARDGSWYIQCLTKLLRAEGHRLDLLTLLTRVNFAVAYEFESFAISPSLSLKKQVPCIQSMLTKQLYFPPK